MKSLFIAPHNDDETLFGAYTIIREQPLVLIVTDSYVQGKRGTGITAEQRRKESIDAMNILGAHIAFLGISDDDITEDHIKLALQPFLHYEKVYAPALQGGHPQHDMIFKVVKELWGDRVVEYATYEKGMSFTPKGWMVSPTSEEYQLKRKALECYTSQKDYEHTHHHFMAVINTPTEYLSKI